MQVSPLEKRKNRKGARYLTRKDDTGKSRSPDKLKFSKKRPPVKGGRFLYDRVVVWADEVRPRVGIGLFL